jgi:HSP20 family protein
MNIIPWKRKDISPRSLQKEMNELFDGFFRGFDLDLFRGGATPALDMHETADSVVVTAEVPGIPVEELDISITGDVLTLRGEKKDEREEKGKNFHRVERSFGSFQRSVQLPAYIDSANVEAKASDGVLTVRIAKKEEVQPRKIDIQVT